MYRFYLDPKSGVPFYRQIIQQVEYAIAMNLLHAGDQLPTVRNLAVELKINPNTVAKAYTEMEIRGRVTTQQGTGTFIAEKKVELTEMEREKKLDALINDLIAIAGPFGFTVTDIIERLVERRREP